MSLLQLPEEMLDQIFRTVGTAFFTKDLRRLTVCKKWYSVALGVVRLHVLFTTKASIDYLLQLQAARPYSNLPLWTRSELRSLTLHIDDVCFCDWHQEVTSADVQETSAVQAQRLHEHLHNVMLGEPDTPVPYLQKLRALRNLTLVLPIHCENTSRGPSPSCETAAYSALLQFAELNLTCLWYLDLSLREWDVDETFYDVSVCHICKPIHKILTKLSALRTIRLALDRVCSDIFEGVQLENPPEASKLKSISLSSVVGHFRYSFEMARECRNSPNIHVEDIQTYADYIVAVERNQRRSINFANRLRKAAQRSAQEVPSLKFVRIIWPNGFTFHAEEMVEKAALAPVTRKVYVRDALGDEVRTMASEN